MKSTTHLLEVIALLPSIDKRTRERAIFLRTMIDRDALDLFFAKINAL